MTEKLIELVRKHPCLYNMKHNAYKNITIKTKLWEQIGKEINDTGDAAKKKWKSLRDNYMRYRREVAGTTGQGTKKFTKWPWASQLQFLEITLSDRERSSNVQQSSSDTYSSETPSPDLQLPETLQPKTPPSHTPPPQTPPPKTPPPQTETPPPQTPPERNPQEMSSENSATRSRNKINKKTDSEMDKVINFLQNKKKKEFDAIDHLFQSYAQTFKSFSKQNQIKVKVELAKLFASIESEELQENVLVLSNSPHYSVINAEDSISYEVTNSGPEDLSPVAVIDLSNYISDASSNQQQSDLPPQPLRDEIDMIRVTNFRASTLTDFHNDNAMNM